MATIHCSASGLAVFLSRLKVTLISLGSYTSEGPLASEPEGRRCKVEEQDRDPIKLLRPSHSSPSLDFIALIRRLGWDCQQDGDNQTVSDSGGDFKRFSDPDKLSEPFTPPVQ